jgi:hypothetical protein
VKPSTTADAALALLGALSLETQVLIRRRLALRLAQAELAQPTERDHELSVVAMLHAECPPLPGWTFRYVQRQRYDTDRPTTSPSSAALVRRYGSWARVCREADRLLTYPEKSSKHISPRPPGKPQRRHSDHDAAAALNLCAESLGRPPSAAAYSAWRDAKQRGKRTARHHPTVSTIIRHYSQRGGWRAALEDAGLVETPRTTLRATLTSRTAAAELSQLLRSHGMLLSHHRSLRWLDIEASTVSAIRELIEQTGASVGTIALWEPSTQKSERIVSSGSRR